jgi:hypothetical protein
VISSIHQARAGGVMLMGGGDLDEGNQAHEEMLHVMEKFDVRRSIAVAVEALKILIEQDRSAQERK